MTSKMSFIDAKALRDRLEDDVQRTSDKLRTFPKLSSGLTPSAAKTPEWHHARAEYAEAHAHLRKFNGWFVRTFKADLAAERKRKKTKNSSKVSVRSVVGRKRNPSAAEKHLREVAEEMGYEAPVPSDERKVRYKGHTIEVWYNQASATPWAWHAFVLGIGSSQDTNEEGVLAKAKREIDKLSPQQAAEAKAFAREEKTRKSTKRKKKSRKKNPSKVSVRSLVAKALK